MKVENFLILMLRDSETELVSHDFYSCHDCSVVKSDGRISDLELMSDLACVEEWPEA